MQLITPLISPSCCHRGPDGKAAHPSRLWLWAMLALGASPQLHKTLAAPCSGKELHPLPVQCIQHRWSRWPRLCDPQPMAAGCRRARWGEQEGCPLSLHNCPRGCRGRDPRGPQGAGTTPAGLHRDSCGACQCHPNSGRQVPWVGGKYVLLHGGQRAGLAGDTRAQHWPCAQAPALLLLGPGQLVLGAQQISVVQTPGAWARATRETTCPATRGKREAGTHLCPSVSLAGQGPPN